MTVPESHAKAVHLLIDELESHLENGLHQRL